MGRQKGKGMDLDKVFKAYDIRGLYPTEVNEELAWKVGQATGQFLRTLLSGYDRGQASVNRIVLGRDMRPHSEPLAKAVAEGIVASGLGCVDVGLCDTPMVYFAINHLGTCGGIQVTASHNPIEYNGLKISGLKARPIGSNTGLKEIKYIVTTVRRTAVPDAADKTQHVNLWAEYRAHILKFLKLARPLTVAVDASNGMAGKMMPEVFTGADLKTLPINYEIGKGFVHPPNPLVEENLHQIKELVKANTVDFGICYDGDADRCMFVDEKGQTIRADLVTALLAKHFLKTNPGATIIFDLRSSRVVAEEIRAAGGVPRRERVGHAFMKKTMADTHAVFGGELSGHFYFRDNFNADSGAIVFAVVASVVAAQDKPLSELVAPLRARYVQSGELNFRVEDKQAKMDELRAKYVDGKADALDGVTIQYPDWWFNVRPSNTEPLLRLNVECRDAKQLSDRLGQLKAILGEPVGE
jgi:phosphomannomutase